MMLSLRPHFLHVHSTLPFLWDGPSNNNKLAKKYEALWQARSHSFIHRALSRIRRGPHAVCGSGVVWRVRRRPCPHAAFPVAGRGSSEPSVHCASRCETLSRARVMGAGRWPRLSCVQRPCSAFSNYLPGLCPAPGTVLGALFWVLWLVRFMPYRLYRTIKAQADFTN